MYVRMYAGKCLFFSFLFESFMMPHKGTYEIVISFCVWCFILEDEQDSAWMVLLLLLNCMTLLGLCVNLVLWLASIKT
jgi:hypothetical protein